MLGKYVQHEMIIYLQKASYAQRQYLLYLLDLGGSNGSSEQKAPSVVQDHYIFLVKSK